MSLAGLVMVCSVFAVLCRLLSGFGGSPKTEDAHKRSRRCKRHTRLPEIYRQGAKFLRGSGLQGFFFMGLGSERLC